MTTAQKLLLLRRAILATVELTKENERGESEAQFERKKKRQRAAIRYVAALFTDPMEPTEGEINFACGDAAA